MANTENRSGDKICLVLHQRRYTPTESVRQLVTDANIGTGVLVKATIRGPPAHQTAKGLPESRAIYSEGCLDVKFRDGEKTLKFTMCLGKKT